MTKASDSRREFIKKLATGVVYSAPVVLTMSAPRNLVGQGKSSEHHDGGGHGDPGGGHGKAPAAPTIGPTAPGATPRPGSAIN